MQLPPPRPPLPEHRKNHITEREKEEEVDKIS